MNTEESPDIDLSEASFIATLKNSSGIIPKNEYLLLSLDIRKEVNRIPKAILVFLKRGTDTKEDQISTKPYFLPGQQIEVMLNYDTKGEEGENQTVFKGVVIKNSMNVKLRRSKFTVELRDVAVGLTRPRKSAVFTNQSDDDIVGKIVAEAKPKIEGLSYEKNDDKKKHDQVVQHYCSDWDFIVSRAEARGRLVVVNDGELSVRKVTLNPNKEENKHKLTVGENAIYDLEFSVNLGQLGVKASENESHAWDFNMQQPKSKKAEDFKLEQKPYQDQQLENPMGFRPDQLSSFAPLEESELQEWVNGHLMRCRLAVIRGRMEVLGSAKYKLLDVVKIDGLGKRYDGTAVITGICHRADINGWNTDLQFGLSARSFSQEPDILDAPAAGLLPGVNGLHIGVVDKFDEKSKKSFQVKVKLPGLAGSDKKKESSVWARLAVPDAGKDRGWFFYPESGDEVVVGFFNDDPRQPVILGSLYSGKNKPPEAFSGISEENKTKVIVSKTGSAIGFIDDKKGSSVFIETATGSKVLIDDSEKTLKIMDPHGNKIIMNKEGIHLKTKKDFKLQADGNVEIKGKEVNIN